MTKKTIRLVIPDWQAGDNIVYALGAKVLKAIAPENKDQKTITVQAAKSQQPLKRENGVTAQSAVLETIKNTQKVINDEKPEKIITFGGNCLVSQQPINYLNGLYGEKLGVIWIDAHPDISNPNIFYNEHAMVLGNLLHRGDRVVEKEVTHPLKPKQIYYAGLQEPTTDEQSILKQIGIKYTIEKGNVLNFERANEWIKENNFDYIYIHLDVDVMSPEPNNFYATYFNNPELEEIPDNAAVGKMQQQSVWDFISTFSKEYDLVGLTLAEYLPWSAKQMYDLMENTKIFFDE
ncbi:arginase family protein [Lactobacillus johnsonii]|uniref:arginase family protein n=1 Tax=Lactobacillus johnsonii TaxID=33959 RepID=UPI003D782209